MSLIQNFIKEYRCWNMLKNACTNKTHRKYFLYGSRGLTWPTEWEDFETFLKQMGPMPNQCDGLLLIDKSKGYHYLNCKWGKMKRGPKSLPDERKGKRKLIENPIQICFSLNKEHYDYIKRQALTKSSEEGQSITANDLMREALIKSFPCPTQYDMFGSKKRKAS